MYRISVYVLLGLIFFGIHINGQAYFNFTNLNWSTRPSDDFFTFVNGYWVNKTVIPPSQTEWGSIYTMSYEISFKLKEILDELTKNGTSECLYPLNSIERKLGDLYLAGLDEQRIENQGVEPLKETFLRLKNVNTYEELILFILDWYKKSNQGLLFNFDVYSDDKNTTINMPIWTQSGLVLPERDYYFRNDPVSKNTRLKYINYIDHLLNSTNSLLNLTTNLIDAEDVLTLETQLAVSHRAPAELRDPDKNYNKYTIIELDHMMPNLSWHRLLNILEIQNTTIIMSQPDYYQLLDKLIVSQPLNVWKNKVRFTILHEMSKYLNKDLVKARYNMFDYLIYGRLEEKPKWMRIIDDIDTYIGESLGKLYVNRYFSYEAKQRTLNLTSHLTEVYHQRILRNQWMSKQTKEKALIKLKKINKKIGFPSQWLSYDDVQTIRTSYFQSMLGVFQYNYRKKIKDLKKFADRNEWVYPPQTVDATYNPSFNEILFYAGILQEPLFSFNGDDAINYGAIGSIIGHELTHGFDDQGRKYDENGNLRSWWTLDDINEFNSRTKLLVEQFNNYKILNTNLNGLLTLGENIADLGGVEMSYEAFLQTEQAKLGLLIDGFTPQQRFFLAYARATRVKSTDAKTLFNIKTDPHAPYKFRLNGVLSNMMGFYQIFNVTENDQMFRQPLKRALIW